MDDDLDPQQFQVIAWIAVAVCAEFIEAQGGTPTVLFRLAEALQNRRTGAFDARLDRPKATNTGLTPNEATIYAYLWAANEACLAKNELATTGPEKKKAAAEEQAVWNIAGDVLGVLPRKAKNRVRVVMKRSLGVSKTVEAALHFARARLRAYPSPLQFLREELPAPTTADRRAASRRRRSIGC